MSLVCVCVSRTSQRGGTPMHVLVCVGMNKESEGKGRE